MEEDGASRAAGEDGVEAEAGVDAVVRVAAGRRMGAFIPRPALERPLIAVGPTTTEMAIWSRRE